MLQNIFESFMEGVGGRVQVILSLYSKGKNYYWKKDYKDYKTQTLVSRLI